LKDKLVDIRQDCSRTRTKEYERKWKIFKKNQKNGEDAIRSQIATYKNRSERLEKELSELHQKFRSHKTLPHDSNSTEFAELESKFKAVSQECDHLLSRVQEFKVMVTKMERRPTNAKTNTKPKSPAWNKLT
jgi:chromosome segregation ATPase